MLQTGGSRGVRCPPPGPGDRQRLCGIDLRKPHDPRGALVPLAVAEQPPEGERGVHRTRGGVRHRPPGTRACRGERGGGRMSTYTGAGGQETSPTGQCSVSRRRSTRSLQDTDDERCETV